MIVPLAVILRARSGLRIFIPRVKPVGSIWGPINQNAAPQNLGSTNIVTANNRVFVARQEKGTYDLAGSGNCIVRAYQVGTANVSTMPLLLE
jgi:hypothetical protein